MTTNKRTGLGVLLSLLLLPLVLGADQPVADQGEFPAEVTAADGQKIDVAKLAKAQRVVVVTLKATWCQVCQQQLVRIKKQLDQIEHCSVSFLVLSPGSAAELNAIQQRTDFPFPFVPDPGLKIGDEMGLILNPEAEELMPAIFILNPDRTIGWIQLGRNSVRYGDSELLTKIDCGNWI
jgi:peroxiredoxin